MNGVKRIPQPREFVLTKKCARCKETKAWADFPPQKYWPDGSVMWVRSMCHRCDYERRQNDPAARERRNAYQRRWFAARRVQLIEDRRSVHLLPAGPFKEWLDGRVALGVELGVIAGRAGVPDRALRRVRSGEHERVAFDTVDACLLDANERVEDLYPELEAAA